MGFLKNRLLSSRRSFLRNRFRQEKRKQIEPHSGPENEIERKQSPSDIQHYRTIRRSLTSVRHSRIPFLLRRSRFTYFPFTMPPSRKRKSSEISEVKYYAVKAGKIPGVYTSWEDCQKNTFGFKGAVCKFAQNASRYNSC